MLKRPKLPGAADFFALEREEPQVATETAPVPTREVEERRAPRAPETPQEAAPRTGEEAPPLVLPEGPTAKVTFYLTPSLLKRLELFKAQLLVEQNVKVTRSQIVDLLLEEGLQRSEDLTAELLTRAKHPLEGVASYVV